jgi:phage FluMu gp28-like protein
MRDWSSQGIDWARYRDYTALAVLQGARDGAKLLALHRWQGLSWAEQVGAVAAQLRQHAPVRILCDRTGVGDPLLETLQREFPHAEGVAFTQALKQSLIENLALMLEQGRLQLLPHPDLLREMYHFEATPTPSGVRLAGRIGCPRRLGDCARAGGVGAPRHPYRYNPHQRRGEKALNFAQCDSNHRLPRRAWGNLSPR